MECSLGSFETMELKCPEVWIFKRHTCIQITLYERAANHIFLNFIKLHVRMVSGRVYVCILFFLFFAYANSVTPRSLADLFSSA